MVGKQIGIDLGTVNVIVYVRGKGVVLNEPSVVAISVGDNRILAVGNEARAMLGRTPETIEVARPIRDGVIADFNAAELMIRELIKLVNPQKKLFPPSWRMMICIPSSITEVEKRAVRDSAE